MEEYLKLILYDWDRTVYALFLLILLSAEIDLVSKEGRSKKNLISALSFSGGKVIVILLTEIVAFYMEFITVYV